MTTCMVLRSYYSLQLLPACSVSLRKGSSTLKRYHLLDKIPDRSIRAKKNETPDHAWIQCNSIHRSRLLFGTKREKLKRKVLMSELLLYYLVRASSNSRERKETLSGSTRRFDPTAGKKYLKSKVGRNVSTNNAWDKLRNSQRKYLPAFVSVWTCVSMMFLPNAILWIIRCMKIWENNARK